MFFRLYKYSLLQSTRDRLVLFWNLIFPIVLGSLFQAAFGNYMEKEFLFQQIPVAYVAEGEADGNFAELLKILEEENEMVTVEEVGRKEAEKLLQKGDVQGIYYNGEPQKEDGDKGQVSLVVAEQGIEQTILQSVLEQYGQNKSTLLQIAAKNPAGLPEALALLEDKQAFVKEGNIMDAPTNNMMDYFYSLIAMNCLMGALIGLTAAVEFKADLTPLAARRVVASTSRFGVLLPDLAAKITMQFFYIMFTIAYLSFALKVPLGERWAFILLTAMVGSMLGVILGFFIGVVGKGQQGIKEGICIVIMLGSSFFSGLMVGGMPRLMETYVPVFNHINPATLITKALYSLNMYGNLAQYAQSMGKMGLLILTLSIGAFLLVRRERYASI